MLDVRPLSSSGMHLDAIYVASSAVESQARGVHGTRKGCGAHLESNGNRSGTPI